MSDNLTINPEMPIGPKNRETKAQRIARIRASWRVFKPKEKGHITRTNPGNKGTKCRECTCRNSLSAICQELKREVRKNKSARFCPTFSKKETATC